MITPEDQHFRWGWRFVCYGKLYVKKQLLQHRNHCPHLQAINFQDWRYGLVYPV